jgi:hypothetical protein
MTIFAIGTMLIGFGLLYLKRPEIFRRGIRMRTSIAYRLLSEENYTKYIGTLGIIYLVSGLVLVLWTLSGRWVGTIRIGRMPAIVPEAARHSALHTVCNWGNSGRAGDSSRMPEPHPKRSFGLGLHSGQRAIDCRFEESDADMVSEAEFLVHLIGQIYDVVLDQTYGLVFWKETALFKTAS